MLDRILSGTDNDEADGGEIERVLGIRHSDIHWALVLWPAADADLDVEDLVQFALTLARAVGGARPLIALGHGSDVWMWTRWPLRRPDPETIAAACAGLRLPEGLRICSGPIVPGLSGFRRSLLGARSARQTFGGLPGRAWCDYTDAYPASLCNGSPEQARWFVEETLGELASNEAWYATLRETLRLYLARGRSRQQVAADMHINRNTVAYRVQKASELIGRPIEEDSFKLRLALEIALIIGATR